MFSIFNSGTALHITGVSRIFSFTRCHKARKQLIASSSHKDCSSVPSRFLDEQEKINEYEQIRRSQRDSTLKDEEFLLFFSVLSLLFFPLSSLPFFFPFLSFFFQTLKNIPKLVSCLFRNGFPAPVPVKSLLCHVPSICRVFRGNSGLIVPSTFLCSLYAAKMEERARADSMYRASIGTTKGNDRERTDWEEWNRGFRFESAPFPPRLFQNCAFCSPRDVCPVTIF